MNLDDQLLLGFQKGEKQAFEAIFNRFKGPIMSFVMGMVRNQSLAEDLTQEVFFKAFRAHERYEKKASLALGCGRLLAILALIITAKLKMKGS